jgi:hypothetical protein
MIYPNIMPNFWYYVGMPNNGMPNIGMRNDGMPNLALKQEYRTTEYQMPKNRTYYT